MRGRARGLSVFLRCGVFPLEELRPGRVEEVPATSIESMLHMDSTQAYIDKLMYHPSPKTAVVKKMRLEAFVFIQQSVTIEVKIAKTTQRSHRDFVLGGLALRSFQEI